MWPPPLSAEDVALRNRAARLLESLRRIPQVCRDLKAWENEHETAFSLFRRGCLDSASGGMLEAPIFNNHQIEDAWLFLLEMRKRHPNRRKHIQECSRVLGASYNWSMVLHGSRKLHAILRQLPEDIRTEVLQDAGVPELLKSPPPAAFLADSGALLEWAANGTADTPEFPAAPLPPGDKPAGSAPDKLPNGALGNGALGHTPFAASGANAGETSGLHPPDSAAAKAALWAWPPRGAQLAASSATTVRGTPAASIWAAVASPVAAAARVPLAGPCGDAPFPQAWPGGNTGAWPAALHTWSRKAVPTGAPDRPDALRTGSTATESPSQPSAKPGPQTPGQLLAASMRSVQTPASGSPTAGTAVVRGASPGWPDPAARGSPRPLVRRAGNPFGGQLASAASSDSSSAAAGSSQPQLRPTTSSQLHAAPGSQPRTPQQSFLTMAASSSRPGSQCQSPLASFLQPACSQPPTPLQAGARPVQHPPQPSPAIASMAEAAAPGWPAHDWPQAPMQLPPGSPNGAAAAPSKVRPAKAGAAVESIVLDWAAPPTPGAAKPKQSRSKKANSALTSTDWAQAALPGWPAPT